MIRSSDDSVGKEHDRSFGSAVVSMLCFEGVIRGSYC